MKTETSLSQILRDRWFSDGPIGFEEFLSLVLYHPRYGYYGSARAKVGATGDFYTNVSVGPVFGEMLVEQFVQIWELLERPKEFYLVEQGAHDGSLLNDVLSALSSYPEFSSCVLPVVIEPSPALQALQQQRLEAQDKQIRWISNPSELHDISGVHFSNELIDALPFALLRFSKGRWMERTVEMDSHENWIFGERALSTSLLEEVSKLPIPPSEPYETEIRPRIRTWMQEILSLFKRGVVLICDYGFSRAEYYRPERTRGTLFCYQNHSRDENPLVSIGEKDISAHVDFSAIADVATEQGWKIAGYTDQHHFLIGVAESWLRSVNGKQLSLAEQKKMRSLQKLLHPESMGCQFRFLACSKGLPEVPLSGFTYTRSEPL